jgi:hypothetical protein
MELIFRIGVVPLSPDPPASDAAPHPAAARAMRVQIVTASGRREGMARMSGLLGLS